MFKVWLDVVGAGERLLQPAKRQKRNVLLFGCAPRPGADISTLILSLLLQRPQSEGHSSNISVSC